MSRLSAVKSVRTDVHCYNDVAFDVEDNAQIRFNLRCVNSARVTGGEFVDLVGTQAWMKRVLLENKKRLACVTLLPGRQLSKTAPKRASRSETIFHLSPGYGSLSAVSRSTNRPASASAMPCLKASGTHESSFSTTNFATCARSLAGRALNCSMISVALVVGTITHQR